ncbi:Uncharacterised protein [Actinomyces bovis]|uniref:dUTPase n=2 Tax=Actinomyces bovis TaxID=1658 RepID=A0ABY1VN07_9ACTO|nr:Uncharacterised protein [Actinomyces bovis]VEG54086.1 Uncharacterised protein [Actinomyces israelii]
MWSWNFLFSYLKASASIRLPLSDGRDCVLVHGAARERSSTESDEAMATDYDAPRKNDDEPEADSLEELTARQKDQSSAAIEEDENEVAEGFELPGADLSREELSVRVVPQLEDEFTCSECFLVHHRSQLAYVDDATGLSVCTDCAG